MSLIRIRDACLAFGHVALLDHAQFEVEEKERVCLIGRNGAGKSTLLSVLAGERKLDSGQLWQRDGLKIPHHPLDGQGAGREEPDAARPAGRSQAQARPEDRKTSAGGAGQRRCDSV